MSGIIKVFVVVFLSVWLSQKCGAQELHFRDTVKAYNKRRILTNASGALVLGGWGIANMATGGVGYFTAKQDEWKYFHEMNAAWGLVNTGFAAYGILRARKQAEEPSIKDAYAHYRHDRRAYLISLGLDVVYVGVGAGLTSYAQNNSGNAAMYKGFGRSIVLQGVALLAYDNFMFAAHQKYNHKWLEIIDEVRFTGYSFTFNHRF